MTGPNVAGPLADVRVLELAGEIGVYAGRILAELGADVIRVEPPGGSPVRRRGPFLDGREDRERSLYHLHFNVQKRGITLDIRRPEGAEIFRRLAAVADVILETAAPGEMDAMGVGYEALREVNPALLYTTVTPFGQTGPMRNYRGNDLIGAAMSGLTWLNGFPEDPPNQPGTEQAYHMASLVAASTTLQHASANAYTWHRQIPARRGLTGLRGGRSLFQCADGRWVSFIILPTDSRIDGSRPSPMRAEGDQSSGRRISEISSPQGYISPAPLPNMNLEESLRPLGARRPAIATG